MERKLSRQAKYNRKVESLCKLLCDRLAHTASLLCQTVEVQVKRNKHKLVLQQVNMYFTQKECEYVTTANIIWQSMSDCCHQLKQL